MNFRNNDVTSFMFIAGVLFIIESFIQFIDWISFGIGTIILLVAFLIDMRKSRIKDD